MGLKRKLLEAEETNLLQTLRCCRIVAGKSSNAEVDAVVRFERRIQARYDRSKHALDHEVFSDEESLNQVDDHEVMSDLGTEKENRRPDAEVDSSFGEDSNETGNRSEDESDSGGQGTDWRGNTDPSKLSSSGSNDSISEREHNDGNEQIQNPPLEQYVHAELPGRPDFDVYSNFSEDSNEIDNQSDNE